MMKIWGAKDSGLGIVSIIALVRWINNDDDDTAACRGWEGEMMNGSIL